MRTVESVETAAGESGRLEAPSERALRALRSTRALGRTLGAIQSCWPRPQVVPIGGMWSSRPDACFYRITFRDSLMVGRRDTGHRGQGDVRHGSHFKDMHKNPNEHVATCMGPNPPNWQLDPPNCRPKLPWALQRHAPRRSARRAGKVEQMSRALALVALTHLRYMHSEHPFMLGLVS